MSEEMESGMPRVSRLALLAMGLSCSFFLLVPAVFLGDIDT